MWLEKFFLGIISRYPSPPSIKGNVTGDHYRFHNQSVDTMYNRNVIIVCLLFLFFLSLLLIPFLTLPFFPWKFNLSWVASNTFSLSTLVVTFFVLLALWLKWVSNIVPYFPWKHPLNLERWPSSLQYKQLVTTRPYPISSCLLLITMSRLWTHW